jgi:ribosomal protein S27AE
MLTVNDWFEESGVASIIRTFNIQNDYYWQIGTNGRSGGYFVLYTGGRKISEHKSACTRCGQRNFKEATPDDNHCGRCGSDERVNGTFHEIFTNMSGTDEDQDFEEWSACDLKDRVATVWDFDRTCEEAVRAFIAYSTSHKVEEEEIYVPKTINVAVPT